MSHATRSAATRSRVMRRDDLVVMAQETNDFSGLRWVALAQAIQAIHRRLWTGGGGANQALFGA